MEVIIHFLGKYGWQILLTGVVSYLLGSISFSILFTKRFDNKKDIRTMGSGNAGFTNVLRSVGKTPAILTLLGDFGKGVAAVVFGKFVFQSFTFWSETPVSVVQYGAYFAGACCLIGHIYPCYFSFKGGKGVLTTAAMMVLLDWRVFLIELGVFAVVFLCSRIISLSSICAATAYPIVTFCITFFIDYLGKGIYTIDYVIVATIVTFLIGALVNYKHKDNLRRLLRGEEKKITKDVKERKNTGASSNEK